jgi:hypothetical protein
MLRNSSIVAQRCHFSKQPFFRLPLLRIIRQIHPIFPTCYRFSVIQIMSYDCLWKPDSIRVFAGEGKPTIDIIGYLKDANHPEAALMNSRKRLEFPSDVYPPNKESKSIIEAAIINAAATVDVHLTRKKTEKMKNGFFATVLGCENWKTYYAQKGSSNDVAKKVFEDMDTCEPCIVKEGIKNDNFINRRAAQRTASNERVRQSLLPAKLVRFKCESAWTPGSAGSYPHGPEMCTTTMKNCAPTKSADAWQHSPHSSKSRRVCLRATERQARLPEF